MSKFFAFSKWLGCHVFSLLRSCESFCALSLFLNRNELLQSVFTVVCVLDWQRSFDVNTAFGKFISRVNAHVTTADVVSNDPLQIEHLKNVCGYFPRQITKLLQK